MTDDATVRSVLIIGAGIAGSAAAISLARAGRAVTVIDIAPGTRTNGSGITLQGNALRILADLGVWAELAEHSYSFDTLGIRAADAHGTLLAEMPDARTGGPDLPATAGTRRAALAEILHDAAVRAGAKLVFGVHATGFDADDDGVDVSLSDGVRERFDLVIGADGVRSATRRAIGIDAEPTPTGMGIWRLICSRPDSVTRTDLFYGGAAHIAGYCPTGPDTMYAYIVETATDRSALDPEQRLATMRALAADYHGPWDDIRDRLTDPEAINYTWFEHNLVPAPWNRGRIVLIGDAAHVCPPTLAQGGAQALEDAVVLSELITRGPLTEQTWAEFAERRIPRAGAVVDASVQLGRWMLDHDESADVPALMGRIAELVTAPA